LEETVPIKKCIFIIIVTQSWLKNQLGIIQINGFETSLRGLSTGLELMAVSSEYTESAMKNTLLASKSYSVLHCFK
jgi:hypothetical protein